MTMMMDAARCPLLVDADDHDDDYAADVDADAEAEADDDAAPQDDDDDFRRSFGEDGDADVCEVYQSF